MMPDQRIFELLAQDIDTAEQVFTLLEQELTALNQRDLETLQSLLKQKQPLLAKLELHSTARSKLLTEHQFSADFIGLSAFAASSAIGAQLLDKSTQLNSLIEQCQAANLRNGRLIRSNQTSVNSMLNIIRGTDSPSLYDKTGSAAHPSQQPPFSQA